VPSHHANLFRKQQRQHLQLVLQQQNSSLLNATFVAKTRQQLFHVQQGIKFVARALKGPLLISTLLNVKHA
jgi:GAF domain-containing protein